MSAGFVASFDTLDYRRLPAPNAGVTSWNGLTGDVKGTLAEIWTFGKGDAPTVDNLFPFDSGNLRFTGSTASGQTPAMAFYESAATPGDSRQGSHIQRRYYQTAAGVGGFITDQHVGYDPLYDGTFGGTGLVQIVTAWVGFTNGAGLETGSQSPFKLGAQRWWSVAGFFDGPGCWPTPGFNSGQREDVWFELYNANSGGGVNLRGGLNGYGQFMNFPGPNSNGLTAAIDTQIDPGAWSAVAGNGIGWLIRYGAIGLPLADPPKGAFGLEMTSGSPATDPWKWTWAAQGVGSGSIGTLMTLDAVNGLVLQVPITTLVPNGASVASYSTGKVNALVAGNYPFLGVPLRPGFIFNPSRIIGTVRASAGVATGSLVYTIGNDVAFLSWVNTRTVTAGTLNGVAAIPPPAFLENLGAASAATVQDGASIPQVHIGTAPTGMTTLTIEWIVVGAWTAV